MEKYVCFGLLIVLLSTALNSALAQNINSYSEVGGTLVLKPSFSGSIENILWKHGDNLAAEWLNGVMDYYGIFRGHTTLDTTTARLEVKNMTENYAGLYTVEINNQVQSQGYNVKVIKRVSKPEVLVQPLICSTTSENCTLSCGNGDTGAGPVTYSWKEDDGEWVKEGKDKTISNEETKRIKTFSCQVKNPVSKEESDPHPNPLFQEEPPPSPVGPVVGVLVVSLVAAGVGVAYWKRKSISLPGGGNEAAPASENGRAPDSAPGEGQPLTTTEPKADPSSEP